MGGKSGWLASDSFRQTLITFLYFVLLKTQTVSAFLRFYVDTPVLMVREVDKL